MRSSAKPGSREHAAAVSRALVCLDEADRHLAALLQGVDTFAGDYPVPGPEERASL